VPAYILPLFCKFAIGKLRYFSTKFTFLHSKIQINCGHKSFILGLFWEFFLFVGVLKRVEICNPLKEDLQYNQSIEI